MEFFKKILERINKWIAETKEYEPELDAGNFPELPEIIDLDQLSEHFHISEFRCKCGCGIGRPQGDLLSKLEILRTRCGDSTINITSGYRCRSYNRKVGGARFSQHFQAGAGWTWAADVQIEGMSPKAVANIADDIFTGVGRYKTFTHVDVRCGDKKRWGKN